MHIEIDLDCKPSNQKEFFKHRSALLVSTKIYIDYLAAKEALFGIEPEMFAEQWMQHNILSHDRSFEDLMITYFIKILQAGQNSE